jgi:hypothetical protein
MKRYFLIFRDADADAPTSGAAPLIGQVDQLQIDAWKAVNPLGCKAIKVGGHIAYFRMPNFDDMNFGYSKLDREKMTELWRAFGDATYLGGSREVLDNPTLFSGAMKLLQKMVDGAEAELVNL